ncbi:MAG: peptide-methionine (S)-S-oxide reductase [Thiotrichales bacterium 32-46-8]|nr:peptide-methionine (S)-S-oxide reductase MsrA [Gammaproteobacteria bacterium]OYX05743.1 MAG: peptide-methionine (S)-S-oxide reductase [Thiotrichales bacterium 32-46-8]OZB87398.1 MAG: peptide-methionine (S)-S-oxide reductase [Thiotrichales bacterium 12-47-6]UCG19288.1 MAG: peptide-methionine (S)-S-oxide reductase MsrA [Thiotrichales bacterium]HQT02829.1 peptide-methionine (S)-S-oxide reductase MsrA [Thiotrichales bacterium]
MSVSLALATLGGGCFWCLEAAFEPLKGVQQVVSGYAGGDFPNPTYELIGTGKTGHAEVVQISFDPSIISYEQLLTVFFTIHDPTTKDRQGNDIGNQYRSIILTHDEAQAKAAQAAISAMQSSKKYANPIVTEIQPLAKFYPAEAYHQDYFKNNPNKAYCQLVVKPKVDKVKSQFEPLLKSF